MVNDVEKILVSVFVVAYNEEQYISQTLDSILNQKTDFAFEIICHDDASTDKTPSIIAEYSKKYPNVVVPVLQKTNKLSTGVNITIEFMYPLAKGKYIAYCDGDDYWTDSFKLQKQVRFLENHKDYVMCLHNYVFLYDGKTQKKRKARCGSFEKDFETEKVLLWGKNIPQIGTSLFIKELALNRPTLYKKVGDSKSKRPISDLPLYIYLSTIGKIRYFPSTMSVWRRHTGTWDSDKDPIKSFNFLCDLQLFYEQFDLETNYRYTKVVKRKIETILFGKAYALSNYKVAFAYIFKRNQIPFKSRVVAFIGFLFPKFADRIRKKK